MAALFHFFALLVLIQLGEGNELSNCTKEWDWNLVNSTIQWTGHDRNAWIQVNVTYMNVTESTCEDTRIFQTDFNDRKLTIPVSDCLDFDHHVKVSLICNENTADSKSIGIRSLTDVTGSPTNLTAAEVTNTTLRLKWMEPRYVNGIINTYHVRYAKTANFDGADMSIVDDTTYLLEGLTPYTRYYIGVRASTSNDDGPWSDTLPVQTEDGVPFAPTGVSYGAVTNSSIEVTWREPVPNRGPITSYKIKWTNQISMLEKSKDVDNTSYVIGNLDPYTEYHIAVQAETKAGHGHWSAFLKFFTKVGVPSAPTALNATQITSRSIVLEWNEPNPMNGPLLNYLVSWGIPGKPSSQNTVNSSEFHAKDLVPYTKYYFLVAAGTEAGFGAFSEGLNVLTDVDIPSSPRNLTMGEVTNTSIAIKWSTPEYPNGPLLSYVIQLLDNPSGTVLREDETNLTSHVIDDLTAYTYYYIQVCAQTKAGRGTFQGDLKIRTKIGVPSAPRNISTTILRATHLTLQWSIPDAVGGPLLDYRVSWGVVGTDASVVVTGDTFYTAIGLRPFTEYYFRLAARTEAGIGVESYSVIRTDTAAPGLPRHLQAADVTENSAQINWLPPEHPNGPDLIYRMTWSIESGNLTLGLDSNITNSRITNLDFSTNYSVRIHAINEAGEGPWSENIFVRTSGKSPPPSDNSLVLALVLGILLPLTAIALVIGALIAKRKEALPCFQPLDAPPRQQAPSRPTIQLQTVTPNTESVVTAKSLTVHSFEEHVKKIILNGRVGFTDEFQELKKQSPYHTCDAAKLDENLIKNRWVKILPFDYSRVKLLPDGPGLKSNFINANYMPGDSYLLEYIASQGPLSNTLDDFWTMVWQQSVPVIVMLTQCVERAVKNCEKYWPSPGETKLYGNIQVQSKTESILTSHVQRVLVLQHQGHKRQIVQMHFTNWPVSGCPRSPEEFLHFVSQVRTQVTDRRPGPILVHCSAGVGRTGTFIAVDRLWQHLQYYEDIDIFGTVLEMRRYRPHMVHTEDQYVFIYSCIQKLLQERNQAVNNIYETVPN